MCRTFFLSFLVMLGGALCAYASEGVAAHPTTHHEGDHFDPPPIWTVLPFVLLLGAIAAFPLMKKTHHWWEKNSSKLIVASGLALVTLLYYLVLHEHPVEEHFGNHGPVAPERGLNWSVAITIFANAILGEFIPFIVLLFALFTIAGGIRISGDLPAHPSMNGIFIGIGMFLASLIGTTGAAMLLIRVLLDTNKERKYVAHTVVFFIFGVCNTGGCLLPIGDPPLFLGYLRGVNFWWTVQLWPYWLGVNCAILALYLLVDTVWFYPRETRSDVVRDETEIRPLQIQGLFPNGLLLVGVILCVALLDPSKPVPGTTWSPPVYLREGILLGLSAVSWLGTISLIRRANSFSFTPIGEVAALFVGIFICMQAPLQILHVEGPQLGLDSPAKFFWATGILSSFLDNAPTYVVFFETARTLHIEGVPLEAGVPVPMLVAISLGSVFMGAMTYIGNGPNFMVKAVAESAGVKMPSFFGYMGWSCCILLPIFVVMTIISWF